MVGEEVLRNPNRVYKGRDAVNSSPSSTSTSSSSSSYFSLSPASEDGGECGLDGMELEAARALACIARTAVRESGGRRLKRFESRSPVRDWEIRNEGWDLATVPEDNEAIRVMVEDKIKAEHISEILPPGNNCSTNSLSSSGRKTRLNLTEVERDAMRMRRVLANRESARQTIRRRQALRAGLTKKVSDLSRVNQNMKIEKGQIMKEYMSLRNKNKQLKTELAMAIACNTMGAEATSPPETSSLPSENSFLVNIKPPFMPGFCPPWPVTAAHSGLCCDQSASHKATEPQTPCSWFCSLLDQMSVSHHLLSIKWKDREIDNPAGCSKAAVAEEKPDMNEQYQRENSATDAVAPLKDKTMKADKSHKLDIDLNSWNVMPEPSLGTLNHFSSVRGEPVRAFVEQPAKFLDANVAASARRRRKEIIKLKHLCGRPIVLHN